MFFILINTFKILDFISLVTPLCRFIFSTDPRGRLKLWSIYQKTPSLILSGARSYDACLFAEFFSCFGLRIMCVDVSFDEEVTSLFHFACRFLVILYPILGKGLVFLV